MFDLLLPGRHLGSRPAVDYVDTLRSKAKRRTGSIHCDVSSTENRHTPSLIFGSMTVLGVICFHEVASCEILVGREHSNEVLSRNSHELRQSGTRSDEDRIKAILALEFLYGPRSSDENIPFDINAHPLELLDLLVHKTLWKTEFRNSVA